jgi:hypothetical protein
MHRYSLTPALALIAATLIASSMTGGASATPNAPLLQSPVAKQLAWVIDVANGGSTALSVAEAERHLAPSLRVKLPANRFVGIAKQVTTAYAPVRFVRFTTDPTATSAIALVKTRSNSALAIYISLDPREPHQIKALDMSPRPVTGRSTMKTAARYTGRFGVGGGRKMYLRCAGTGNANRHPRSRCRHWRRRLVRGAALACNKHAGL